MLFSHMKRSLLLWLHMKIVPLDAFREMIQYFIGVYITNRILLGRLGIRNFSSRVEKYFTRSLHSVVKYFSTLEEKFRISKRPCNILSVYFSIKVLSCSYQNLLKGSITLCNFSCNLFRNAIIISTNFFTLRNKLFHATCLVSMIT